MVRRGDTVKVNFGLEGTYDCVVFKVTANFICIRDKLHLKDHRWSESIPIHDWERERFASVIERAPWPWTTQAAAVARSGRNLTSSEEEVDEGENEEDEMRECTVGTMEDAMSRLEQRVRQNEVLSHSTTGGVSVTGQSSVAANVEKCTEDTMEEAMNRLERRVRQRTEEPALAGDDDEEAGGAAESRSSSAAGGGGSSSDRGNNSDGGGYGDDGGDDSGEGEGSPPAAAVVPVAAGPSPVIDLTADTSSSDSDENDSDGGNGDCGDGGDHSDGSGGDSGGDGGGSGNDSSRPKRSRKRKKHAGMVRFDNDGGLTD